MTVKEADLPMMLDAREARQHRQKELQAQYGLPLLCFSMNIAGPIKRTPAILLAHRYGREAIEVILGQPIYKEEINDATGCETYFIYDKPAEEIKEAAVAVEEGRPIGRLFDMDVLMIDGEKLSRSNPRKCLVCGGPAFACARNRAHGLDAVRQATQEILTDFACGYLGQKASDSLLAEARFSPKPGLVDSNNSGAHKDMDLAMLKTSAKALTPFFAKAVRAGATTPLSSCFEDLVSIGKRAEAAMFAATGGVNTHKGAIYNFLIMLGAFGHILHRGGNLFEVSRVLAKEDKRVISGTHGAGVAAKYGAPGMRQQALEGFPHVRRGLAIMEQYGPYAVLLDLFTNLTDTNVLHRGGPAALAYVKESSQKALDALWPIGSFNLINTDAPATAITADGTIDKKAVSTSIEAATEKTSPTLMATVAEAVSTSGKAVTAKASTATDPTSLLLAMDEEYISRNISPGGAADLFAMVLFISAL